MIVPRHVPAARRPRRSFGIVSTVSLLLFAACSVLDEPATLTETERSVFEARARELSERLDPIEVEDLETPPAAPSARRDVQPEADAALTEAAAREETAEAARVTPPVGLTFYVFDTGQADSMLVIGPAPDKKTLLIDLGEDRARGDKNHVRVASRIRRITGSAHLDYFVVTHYHDDHIGDANDGIAGLLDWVDPQFTIGTLIDIGDEGKEFMKARRGTYERFDANVKKWLARGDVRRREKPRFGRGQIDLGAGVEVEILAFAGRVHKNDKGALDMVERMFPGRYGRAPASENDLSIALEVGYKDFELFTAGDLTGYNVDAWTPPPTIPLFMERKFRNSDDRQTYTNVEKRLVDRWKTVGRETDVEIYRANHHGSSFSSSPMLLEALDPEFILFSTAGGYGHPDPVIIRRGAATATLMATADVAQSSRAVWNSHGGKIVNEILIRVAESGKTYTIERKTQTAFTDPEERQGQDQPSP